MVHSVKSKSDFESQLIKAGDKLVVAMFGPSWCGATKSLKTEYLEAEKMYADVVFLEVDADKQENITNQYNVKCYPTCYFIKNKATLNEFSGSAHSRLHALIKELN